MIMYKTKLKYTGDNMNFKRIAVIMCIIYVLIWGVFVYYTNRGKIRNVIEFYREYQNELLDYVKIRFEEMPDEYNEDPEHIEDIFDLGYTYGFVYSDNEVIFEKNLETTEKYSHSTVRELFNDYAQESGNINTPNIMRILFNDSGTAYIRKNTDTGREIMSWRNINKNNKEYVVGISVPIDTVLEVSKYKKYTKIDIAAFAVNTAAVCGGVYVMTRKIKG